MLVVGPLIVAAACSRAPRKEIVATIASDEGKKAGPPPDAPAPPSVSISSTPPPVKTFVAKKEYEKNLASARKFTMESLYDGAITLSCGLAGTFRNDALDAAVIRYQCTHEVHGLDHDMEGVDMSCMGCTKEGVRLVGGAPDNVLDVPQVGFVEVLWTNHTGLWNLKGDGLFYAVVVATQCTVAGSDCTSEQDVYVLDDHRFSRDDAKLDWPLVPLDGELDVDKDGKPELVARVWTAAIDEKIVEGCAPKDQRGVRTSPGDANDKTLSIDGLISWVPTGFSTTLALFRPWYETRLRLARAAATTLIDGDACELPTLRTAAEIYVYQRMLGATDEVATKEASAIADALPSWPGMLHTLAADVYPALTDKR